MRLECRWRHTQKRWSWEFEDFEKTTVQIRPLKMAGEVLLLRCAAEFFRSRLAEMNWDLKHHKMCCVLGWVSIIWLASTFKKCVSHIAMDWSQKLIKPFESEMKESACICRCIYVTIVIDIIMDIQHRERWQWRGALHSSNLLHHWNLMIRLFSVISRTLIRGDVLPLCREAVSVFYSLSQVGNQILVTELERISICFFVV